MKKAVREELYNLKKEASSLFQNRCFVCHVKFDRNTAFQYHHKGYTFTDKTWKDFKDGNGKFDSLEYHKYLIPVIKANPKRFLFLCWAHHQAVERLKRFNKNNFKRLVRAVNQSR